MELDYTYWQTNDGWFVGFLSIWPDHLTQGKTVGELEEMLADLYGFYKEEQNEVAEKRSGKIGVCYA
jgi:predicted RNase H-like HicB family nuclease